MSEGFLVAAVCSDLHPLAPKVADVLDFTESKANEQSSRRRPTNGLPALRAKQNVPTWIELWETARACQRTQDPELWWIVVPPDGAMARAVPAKGGSRNPSPSTAPLLLHGASKHGVVPPWRYLLVFLGFLC